MTLEKQLLRLLQRRRLELGAAARDYGRLKRQLNPDRFLRRHMGPALATAGILGLILAPGPARPRAPQGRFRYLSRAFQWMFAQLRPAVPVPPAKDQSAAASDRDSTMPRGAPPSFADLLLRIVGQLDWEAILRALITSIQRRHSSAEESEAPGSHDHNGHRAPDAPTAPAESSQPESP